MALDTYSKMLILVNFLVLLLLKRYLNNRWMFIPFVVLMVLQWFWLYRIFSPLGFEIPAAISVVTALSLYFPNTYVRILSITLVFPAIAAAVRRIFADDAGDAGDPSKS